MTRAVLLLLGLVLTFPVPSAAQDATPSSSEEFSFGTMVAPAALPDGASALYGYVGVPEMGAGYRQGISGFELEWRARLDYFRLAGIFEAGARRAVVKQGPITVAPRMSLGLVLNSGSNYLDADNSGGVLLRLSPGLVVSWNVAETVAVVGLLDVPIDLGMSPSGSWRLQALTGGGTEIYLGSGITLLTAGQIGLDHFKPPLKDSVNRVGYQVTLGIGTRLF